ncbi:DUF2971 domain-containing protein, partial [Salmonella enterica]|nr:DUF2971 domain-containing protein [Salmonella enterica]
SIIKNKKLWLSSMDHLNDFMEKRLFISEFEKFINESEDPKVYQSIRRSIEANMNLGTPYLCCLSGSGDILSQWRSYGQDGYGLSIGFDPDKLVAHKGTKIMNNGLMEYSIFLNKVEYLDTKSIYDLIATLMHEYRGVVKFHNGNLDFDNQPPIFKIRSWILIGSSFILIHILKVMHLKKKMRFDWYTYIIKTMIQGLIIDL